MESALFSNVKKLYDYGLYECVVPTASLLCTLLQNDRSVATLETEYQVRLYLSNAHYKEHNYRTACQQLEAVVQQRKAMVRYKSSYLTGIESSYPQFQDTDLRYKIAVCYRELGEYNMAISTLEAVKMRTPRLNLLLAKLLHHHGRCVSKKDIAVAYKDVLPECPMSLTAIEALIELGIEGHEVHSLVVNAATMPKNIEWLSSWIKGHAQMYGCKHLEAANTFQQLNDTTLFRQNEQLLTKIGQCLYYYGNYVKAEQYLSMAVMINAHNMDALCALSVVYQYNGKKRPEQEKLITPLRLGTLVEFTAAHWFLHGQLTYMNSRFDRALIFAERCLTMDPRNIEAMLLRSKLFGAMGRHKDAIDVLRSAQCLAPYRFEIYKGLVASYLRLKWFKEAQSMCLLAVRYFRTSPRSYTMFGGTLFNFTNQEAKKSARKFVEKALQIDEHYMPGVILMAGIYQYEGTPREAIVLLRKQVTNYPHPKLFAMLAEMLSTEKDLDGALHFFTLALRLDPTFRRALDGINALTKAARAGSGSSIIKTSENSSSNSSTSTNVASNVATMATPCGTPNHDWLLDCDETSNEALELSSPVVPQEDTESDSFSEPFWQDVDGDMPN
ncbi:anaphase-promoting complex subunit 7 [Drosophila grimshawi]|uniref:GH24708 n=1 Tax=Drosophila grimshawi TaxID=7222 RepID=B4JMX9_DROGR|nr:anaphase-promoting complex subunit 7 [Drosophila grimshawi]EDV92072.1 GH24708 [Drosophila grimshawi]